MAVVTLDGLMLVQSQVNELKAKVITDAKEVAAAQRRADRRKLELAEAEKGLAAAKAEFEKTIAKK